MYSVSFLERDAQIDSTSSFGEIGVPASTRERRSGEVRPVREEMKKKELEYSLGFSSCTFTIDVSVVSAIPCGFEFTGDEEEVFFKSLVAVLGVCSIGVDEGAST